MSSEQINKTNTLKNLEEKYIMLFNKMVGLRNGCRIVRGMHLVKRRAIVKQFEQTKYEIFIHILEFCQCDTILKFSNYFNGFFSEYLKQRWIPHINMKEKNVSKFFDKLKLSYPSFKYFVDVDGNILKNK